MPRFDPDFVKTDAGIPTHPKGRYQLKVGTPKPFVQESRKGDKVISGVRYPLTVVGQYNSKGKLVREGFDGRACSPNTVWLHTDKAWGMGKQFIMAAAGFARDQEGEANEKFFSKHDFSFSGEIGEEATCGDGYRKIVDQLVDVNLDVSRDGEFENQDFRGWSPPAA